MARIDHFVYAVPELDTAMDRFEASTGIRPAVGGAHVGMGTHNALVSLGANYLELIAPDPAQPTPARPRPFGIDALDGSAFVGFAVRPDAGDTIDALVERARAAGHDTGPIVDMERATPDGDTLRCRLTMPAAPDAPPAVIPFVIDWGTTPMPSDTQPGGVEMMSMSVRHPDPPTVTAAYAALGIDVPVTRGASAIDVQIVGPVGTFTG